MKKCKHCQSEIDKKAKICPHCRKSQKSVFSKIIGIILIFIGFIIVIASIGGESTTEDKFGYEITKQYEDSIGSYYIEGIVTNKIDYDYSYTQIDFICYDKDGNNLGTAMANTNNLLANETWRFKAIGLFDGKVDHCDFKEVTGW